MATTGNTVDSPFLCETSDIDPETKKAVPCGSLASHVSMSTVTDPDEGEKVQTNTVKMLCRKHLRFAHGKEANPSSVSGSLLSGDTSRYAFTDSNGSKNSVRQIAITDLPAQPRNITEQLMGILIRKPLAKGVIKEPSGPEDVAIPEGDELTDTQRTDLAKELAGELNIKPSSEAMGRFDSGDVSTDWTHLQEEDAVAHYNRWKQEKVENERENSRQAARRSRGLPAMPAKRPGRPTAEAAPGMADVRTWEVRKNAQVTGVDIDSSGNPTVRPAEIPKSFGGKSYMEQGHAPERSRGQSPSKVTAINPPEPFIASHYAPMDPVQAPLFAKYVPENPNSEEEQDTAYLRNLVGAQRTDDVSQFDNSEDGQTLSEAATVEGQAIDKSMMGGDQGYGSTELEQKPISSNKVYPLAVKQHTLGHAIAWHRGATRLVHIEPSGTKDRNGRNEFYWIPTTTKILNKDGSDYSFEQVNADPLYMSAQHDAEKMRDMDTNDPAALSRFVRAASTVAKNKLDAFGIGRDGN